MYDDSKTNCIRSKIQSQLVLQKDVRYVSRFFFASVCPVLPAALVGMLVFSPLHCLCFFAKVQVIVFMWVYFWLSVLFR